MENKFSCDVIMDLLPSYVDGICSEETVKLVEEHLKSCEACKASYTAMKQDDVTSDLPGLKDAPSSEAKATAKAASGKTSSNSPVKVNEQEIMKKVNRKMRHSLLGNTILGIVVGAVVLTLALFLLKPGKKISPNDYQVKIENMNLQELAAKSSTMYFDFHNIPQNSIMVFEEGKSVDDCLFTLITIPGYSDAQLAVDKAYMVKYPEICLVTIYSQYSISSYDNEVKQESGKNVLYVDNVKTPIFGGAKSSDWGSVTTVEMCHIDEVKA